MSVTDLSADDPSELRTTPTFPVVGIGASAGGVQALIRFFGHMPERPGMAFVVVMHLSPEHESALAEILQRQCRLPVRQVSERTPLAPDEVYIISPAQQLAMADGHLETTALQRPIGRRVAIDVFFRSLAEAHRERAIAIVLSGSGADGSVGLRRVKEVGGLTLAQTPGDAEYDEMPASAIASGAVDFVLPVDDMPLKLEELWTNARRIELPYGKPPSMLAESPSSPSAAARAEHALGDIMVLLRARTGHDFRHYKRATVLRRIERRLQVNGVPTLPSYLSFLESNAEETTALLRDMLISVTHFFRDREAFEALQRLIDARLLDSSRPQPKVRAWVAGCASGEEAYSVAMLLAERSTMRETPPQVQVFASDIDERAIAVARAGLYPLAINVDVSEARLRQFFVKEGSSYRVRQELRERVLFAAHNLLRDPPFINLDLMCCRNLLIYLEREVQMRVLEVFHFALRPGGLLFLGSSESADAATGLFTVVDKKNRIYVANSVPRTQRVLPNLPGMRPLSMTLPPPLHQPAPSLDQQPAVVSVLGALHHRLLEAQGPASVLVDSGGNILHSSGRISEFLRFTDGPPTQDLLAVVRPELRLELRTAMFRAGQTGERVEARRVRLADAEPPSWVLMTVRPAEDAQAAFTLVSFDKVQALLEPPAESDIHTDPVLALLEAELQQTRDQLNGSLGRSATSSEELRASNEELQAINEELRSATEELETSKEELQSLNEELITVNHELKIKIDETSKVNDDLKNLIASTDIATIFIDRFMRIKRFTPRATDLFNLIDGDVGRPLMDITRRVDYPEMEADAATTFESLRAVEREVGGAGGRQYLARLLPYRTHEDVIDGAVLTFVDITATRRAEQQARATESDMRLVVESTEDYGIITMDPQGRVKTWNAGARRLFGYSADEMVGQQPLAIYSAADRLAGAFDDELRRARDTGRALDERWHVTKDGRSFYCSGVMTPLYDEGLKGYAKIARDVTSAKHAEAQLEMLLQSEQAVRTELQAASVLKDEFLAVMSHELKHPLNLIQINAELLSRLPEVRDAPAVARAADVIRRTVVSQAKIIDDLLDLSRLHTGKLTLQRETVNWATIVAAVVDAVREDAQSLGLALTMQIDDAAALIDADAVRVEQIVWNLVSNALKFTPPGGSVELRLTHEAGEARLDVIDTGHGIEPSLGAQVFDMFRQAARGPTRPQGGLGIGLALVKLLAEQHGGRVAVASEGVGHGTTFSVWLPLSRSTGADMPADPARPGLSGLRILLVDDTPDTLDSFAALLQLEGAEVATAGSGEKALQLAREGTFDLVLSDIAMPGMDGYELIRRLREIEPMRSVAAVALTGFGRAADEQHALAAGFDAHLAKPVSLEALIPTVRRLRH